MIRLPASFHGSTKQENVSKDLAAENERLKKLIGEQTIVIDAFKKTRTYAVEFPSYKIMKLRHTIL